MEPAIEGKIRDLYKQWIESWNERDAQAMGRVLDDGCNMIGFDGSQMNGKVEICKTLKSIFEQHPTARFVNIVKEVRNVAPTVYVLRAVVGMVPRGHFELNPAVNAIQTMVAVEKSGAWLITVFQNTPAAFHGRPELAENLTNELRTHIRDLPKEH